MGLSEILLVNEVSFGRTFHNMPSETIGCRKLFISFVGFCKLKMVGNHCTTALCSYYSSNVNDNTIVLLTYDCTVHLPIYKQWRDSAGSWNFNDLGEPVVDKRMYRPMCISVQGQCGVLLVREPDVTIFEPHHWLQVKWQQFLTMKSPAISWFQQLVSEQQQHQFQ